jgi:hypothetical protein
MHKLRKFVANFLFFFVACLAAVLLAELFVRVFFPQITAGGGYDYRDEYVFDLKANYTGEVSHPDYTFTVHSDENRLRRTWNPEKSNEDLTILVLGDAFAFGVGVEDNQTFASVISKQLIGSGISSHVFNAGVAAYNLGEIACKYERVKDIVRPDIVIVAAAYNDFQATLGDCDSIYRGKKWRDSLQDRQIENRGLWSKIYPQVRNFILGNSHLAVFLVKRSLNFMIQMGLRKGFQEAHWAYNPVFHQYAKNRVDHVPVVLKKLHTDIQRDGSVGVFVYIPGISEMDNTLWDLALKTGKVPLARDFPHRHLTTAAKEAGFSNMIDPISDPVKLKILKTSYFHIDAQLNVNGNAFFGKWIAEVIRNLKKTKAESN